MKKPKLETITLPDGVRFSGYKNELVFQSWRQGIYFEQARLERWFLPRAGEIACVYDIGANLGNHTVYFASHAKNSTVYSFEPVPVTFDLLKRNVEQNGLSERVKLFQCALGAKESSAKMKVEGPGGLAFSSITRDVHSVWTQEVAVKRLDDMNLPPPDFVKIDVEGYELEVLKGMERTLRESSPVLWIEIGGRLPNDQAKYEFLSSLSYIPVDSASYYNILFEKRPENEKIPSFCAFIPKVQVNFCEAIQHTRAAYESRSSWKITAPLRAIRGIFRRH